ncbi:MAG: hypothetical protein PWP59_744 [Sphaerochaeta sp.]|jgi:hypothetical protein|nr:hypothetical protein [Sphaerochaeta sp.]
MDLVYVFPSNNGLSLGVLRRFLLTVPFAWGESKSWRLPGEVAVSLDGLWNGWA